MLIQSLKNLSFNSSSDLLSSSYSKNVSHSSSVNGSQTTTQTTASFSKPFWAAW
ncbi:hypothetical protein PPL_03651 [Heterostelium album PN500]|uniref:Uncharacterized protein n=1 Tax=Heterostelium pallidum (strain ATCC 26659 / Pp 5 / PN500) TaxID=670386 RepID=D3B6A3_HETP5|nr:hypothetical protein PPL_03651 [Heterostelium album PN500]EFA82873.1 hypothetical protein PPL_03651 [Heterostelium album PN500]|eukprot:XP_020434990.1 hypothetical protein PPL_03651 [Heterostelium album PN500]